MRMTNEELLEYFETQGHRPFRSSKTKEWAEYEKTRAEILSRMGQPARPETEPSYRHLEGCPLAGTPPQVEPRCPKCKSKRIGILWSSKEGCTNMVECPDCKAHWHCSGLLELAQFFAPPATPQVEAHHVPIMTLKEIIEAEQPAASQEGADVAEFFKHWPEIGNNPPALTKAILRFAEAYASHVAKGLQAELTKLETLANYAEEHFQRRIDELDASLISVRKARDFYLERAEAAEREAEALREQLRRAELEIEGLNREIDAPTAGGRMPEPPQVEPFRSNNPWHLFHHLWTKAVGSPHYAKQEWRDMESILIKAKVAVPPADTEPPKEQP
jgi:hypothetical protein